MMGGIKNSAAIHPTNTANTISLSPVQFYCLFVNTLAAPPTPEDMIQQVLAPIASIIASILISPNKIDVVFLLFHH